MSSKLTRTIIGALVAIALAVAVSYGLISQQTADGIQTQADQTLSGTDAPAPGQPAPRQPPSQNPTPQNPTPQDRTPPDQPAPGSAAPAQRP